LAVDYVSISETFKTLIMKRVKIIIMVLLTVFIAENFQLNAQRGPGYSVRDSIRKGRTDSVWVNRNRMQMGPGSDRSGMYGMGHWRNAPAWGRPFYPGPMGRWADHNWNMPGRRGMHPMPPFYNRGRADSLFAGRMDRPFSGRNDFLLERIPDLTDSQKTRLKELMEKNQSEMKKFRDETAASMKKMRDQHREKMLEILNPEQKKWFESRVPSPQGK
jgi:Spy/CpxP family protein refolding chaperone